MTDIQPHTDGPTLPELMAQVAVIETLGGELKKAADKLRLEAATRINARHEDTGEWFAGDVRLPGTKTKVGKVSTSTHSSATVLGDAAALTEWATENAPHAVTYPPVLDETFVKLLLKSVEFGPAPGAPEGSEDVALWTNPAGEQVVVPGITRKAGGGFKSFSILQKDKTAILAFLNELGVNATIEQADKVLEAAATTVTGEVVQGEVVAKDEQGEEAAA